MGQSQRLTRRKPKPEALVSMLHQLNPCKLINLSIRDLRIPRKPRLRVPLQEQPRLLSPLLLVLLLLVQIHNVKFLSWWIDSTKGTRTKNTGKMAFTLDTLERNGEIS